MALTRFRPSGEALENIPMTMEITMPLAEWRNLMRQLGQNYPSWAIGREIAEAIGRVTRAVDNMTAPEGDES